MRIRLAVEDIELIIGLPGHLICQLVIVRQVLLQTPSGMRLRKLRNTLSGYRTE